MFTSIPAPSLMKNMCNEYFLSKINSSISAHPWILPITALARSSYVCENKFSSVITEFKLDCAKLGNKQPRLGHVRKPFCPLCPMNVPNTPMHMLFSCGSLSALRHDTGIQSYILQCRLQGLTMTECYKLFVNGLTSQGNPLDMKDYLERGKIMSDMRELWLSKW